MTWATAAGLAALIGLVVLAYVLTRVPGTAGDSVAIGPTPASGEEPTAASSEDAAQDLEAQIQERLAAVGRPGPLSHAAGVFGEGVERLLASSGVEITYTARGTDAGPVAGEAVVAPAAGSLVSRESTELATATPVVERRVVGGTLYIRALAGVPADEAGWDAIPVDALVEADADRAFVAGGRVASSLPRLVDLLATAADPEALNRVSEDVGEGLGNVQSLTIGDGSYRLVLPVRMIAAINQEEHFEIAEYPVSGGAVSVFEFTIDATGTLTALSAYGVLLQDAEPIGPAIVDVSYRPMAEPVVTPPPANDVRR